MVADPLLCRLALPPVYLESTAAMQEESAQAFELDPGPGLVRGSVSGLPPWPGRCPTRRLPSQCRLLTLQGPVIRTDSAPSPPLNTVTCPATSEERPGLAPSSACKWNLRRPISLFSLGYYGCLPRISYPYYIMNNYMIRNILDWNI